MSVISDYTIDKIIGRGSYGIVYKVHRNHTRRAYAMKKIKTIGINLYEKQNIINELRLLSTHKCPFIIKFKHAFVDATNIYIITEYAEKGDLAQLIQQRSKTSAFFEEHIIWNYFLQTCVALCYLHNLKIIHRDIKPANIFIDQHDNVKLGDFGVIKMMKSFMMYGQTQIGTPLYMCPEMYKRERYDTKVDNWALGCILYEMMTLKPAFSAKNIYDLRNNIYRGKIGHAGDKYSANMQTLLLQLINIFPRQRTSIHSLFKSSFIKHEMELRGIHLSDKTEILPAFFLKCQIPRTSSGWEQVVSLFVDLNATVELNNDEKAEMEIINKAKKSIIFKKTQAKLNQNIEKLQKDIENAKQFIAYSEESLNILLEQKKELMKNIVPTPPSNARKPNQTPRITRY